jgi:hypothetical protein
MMPIATSCPILPIRSEILLAALLVVCLAAELAVPVAARIVCAAFFVPLSIVAVVSTRLHQADDAAPGLSQFLPSLAPRAPPVS